eukprot:UN14223
MSPRRHTEINKTLCPTSPMEGPQKPQHRSEPKEKRKSKKPLSGSKPRKCLSSKINEMTESINFVAE